MASYFDTQPCYQCHLSNDATLQQLQHDSYENYPNALISHALSGSYHQLPIELTEYQFPNSEVLNDVLIVLKEDNHKHKLKEKQTFCNQTVYRDYGGRDHYSASFILFRNTLNSYTAIHRELILMCRRLEIPRTITQYAAELFDKLHTELILLGCRQQQFTDSYFNICFVKLNDNFGKHLLFLHQMNLRCDSLFGQLWDFQDVAKYARLVCMVVCIIIASKQSSTQSYLRMNQASNHLLSIDVPHYLCRTSVLAHIEKEILYILKFKLNLTTLTTFVETILELTAKRLIIYEHFNQERIERLHTIAELIIENYYLLQIPFLTKLFVELYQRPFDLTRMADVEILENLHRERLLIASAIVVATFVVDRALLPVYCLVEYVATLVNVHPQRVHKTSQVVLDYLFDPSENFDPKQQETTIFHFDPCTS